MLLTKLVGSKRRLLNTLRLLRQCLYSSSFIIMKNLVRLFSTSKSFTVYEAPYFESLSAIKNNFIKEASSILKGKYYGFIPFYLESRLTLTAKRFVVKMELLPETKSLKITSLQLGSLITKEIPISNVVPVTFEDYELAHFGGKLLESAEHFDLDMIYINRPDQEFLVFDKEGKWNEDAVNHKELSMESTFNEHKWYDFGCGPTSPQKGGNPSAWP